MRGKYGGIFFILFILIVLVIYIYLDEKAWEREMDKLPKIHRGSLL